VSLNAAKESLQCDDVAAFQIFLQINFANVNVALSVPLSFFAVCIVVICIGGFAKKT
jgi:hypothetical protein